MDFLCLRGERYGEIETGVNVHVCVQTREKKTSKMEQSGLTEAELLQQQQELFRSATDKYHSGPTDA